MKPLRRIIYSLPPSLLLALNGAAFAQDWKTGRGNEHFYAEISSRERGGALRIECGDGKDLWLRYYPGRGWNGGLRAAVRAGTYTSPMEIDGGDGALLSNAPAKSIGITRALIDAMKNAQSLVIEGPAAARVPLGQRTFVLARAAEVIGALETKCR